MNSDVFAGKSRGVGSHEVIQAVHRVSAPRRRWP